MDGDGVTTTVVTTTIDPVSTVPTYDTPHDVGLDGAKPASPVDVTGKRLVMSVTGEADSHSVINTMMFLGATIRFCCAP